MGGRRVTYKLFVGVNIALNAFIFESINLKPSQKFT